jgi:hypothetical protein
MHLLTTRFDRSLLIITISIALHRYKFEFVMRDLRFSLRGLVSCDAVW